MKKCSISFVIREMEIRTTMRCHFTSTGMAVIKKMDSNKCFKDVKNLASSYSSAGNVKCGNHFGSSNKKAIYHMIQRFHF